MNAAEAVARYRKSAGVLRRMRCWAGSPPRTKTASIKHEGVMAEALAVLRELRLEEIIVRLREERRLLNAAYGADEYDPDGAAANRSKTKRHQYRVSQLIRGYR